MLGASAITVKRASLSTGQVPPGHWAEGQPLPPISSRGEGPCVRSQFLPQGIGVRAASVPTNGDAVFSFRTK